MTLLPAIIQENQTLQPYRSRIMDLVRYSKFNEAVIRNQLSEQNALTIEERVIMLEIASEYQTTIGRVKSLLLERGMTPEQVEAYYDLKEEVSQYDAAPVPAIIGDTPVYLPPRFPDHLSFKNLDFLQRLAGEQAETQATRELIDLIQSEIEETQSPLGLAYVVHRMRECHENTGSMQPASLLAYALNTLPVADLGE